MATTVYVLTTPDASPSIFGSAKRAAIVYCAIALHQDRSDPKDGPIRFTSEPYHPDPKTIASKLRRGGSVRGEAADGSGLVELGCQPLL